MSKRNWPGITLQTLAWIVLALAVSLPYWLHLDAVGARYPFVRTWGLFDVHGKTRRSHAEVSQIACEAKSQLTTLQSNCTYGICEWYAAKCNAYPMIALSSYITAALMLVSAFMMLLTSLLSLRPRLAILKIVISVGGMAFVCTLGAICTYFYSVRTAFQVINTAGYYPMPQPGLCFYLAQLGAFFQLVSMVSNAIFMRGKSRSADIVRSIQEDAEEARIRLRAA